ncbi:hypothetical protein Taro_017601 [Colocasia esculenta]|uniref:Myb/SANT-like domain-containing protein n=1 Tax=Colocasia esculenta TaxID=4460 RepID=A0A843UNK1_COLES|nr:hypothetical protein [Colocasia esculenta]
MSPILSEILLSGFMINSTLRHRTHLVQSFSVVFLYWFYVFSTWHSDTRVDIIKIDMDVNDFSYEDEMDAAIVGVLSACVGVLEIVVDNSDNSGELSESIPRIRSSTRNEIRRNYVQSVIGIDDATSIKMIHMNRRTFYQLYAVVRRRNLLHDTIHVSVQEQLLMFLHTIAHNQILCEIFMMESLSLLIFACDCLDVNCDYFFRMESFQSQDTSSSKKGNSNFRWSMRMSRFMQKSLVEQAANGMKVDKSFKRPAFVATARAVSEKFKVTCSDSNVENHLRTLKTKYAAIKKLKGMSGVGWNDDAKMITMDDDTFNEYIAAHPKDEPYINKSIDMYEELVIICGDDQATGSFSRTVADSMVDVDSTSVDTVNEETSETPPPPRSIEDHSTSSEQVKRGRKRRRDLDSKIDLLANKIGDLASAISRSRNRDISFELYEEYTCKDPTSRTPARDPERCAATHGSEDPEGLEFSPVR